MKYSSLGNLKEALKIQEDASQIAVETFGTENSITLNSLYNLALHVKV